MGIVKKVQFYKRALQALFAINIFVLTAGVIAGVSYFGAVEFMKVLTQQNTDRLKLLDSMESDLLILSEVSPNHKATRNQIRHLESLRFKLESWPDSQFAQITLPDDIEQTSVSTNLVSMVHQRILTEKKTLLDQLSDASEKLGSLAQQLFILGICTLVFGIILPVLVFRKLSIEMNTARLKVEEKISHWLANWFETHAAHGESPFQDPTFWLKVILLTVETFAPQSRHPLAQFIGDFAPTLRKEMERKRTGHTETQPKTTRLHKN